jgi:hypothetical protein
MNVAVANTPTTATMSSEEAQAHLEKRLKEVLNERESTEVRMMKERLNDVCAN